MSGLDHDLHAPVDGQKKSELFIPTSWQTDVHEVLLIVAHIRRLPVELLVEVFVYCLPDDIFITPCPKSAPLLLTRVCSSWRNIALSSPKLWSSIRIDIDFYLTPQKVSTLASRVASWLARSAQHHLSIDIYIGDEGLSQEPLRTVVVQEAIKVFNILFLHVVQWRHIRWNIELPEVLAPSKPYTAAIENTVLHTLDINVQCMSHDLSTLLNAIMKHSPQLRNYSYHDYDPMVSSDIILKPPWASLIHVNLGCFTSPEDALEIFQAAHSLVQRRLHLGIVLQDHLDDSLNTVIGNHSLQILEIGTNAGLRGVLNRLALPNLRDLTLSVDLYDGITILPGWSQSSFFDFITQSSCHLQCLILKYMRLAEEDLIACLQLTSSSLKILLVADQEGTQTVTDAVLSRLRYTPISEGTVSCLCPKLETLTVVHCCSCSDGAFAAMIESRWKVEDEPSGGTAGQCARIRRVHLGGDFSHEDKLRLLALAEEGLDAFCALL